VGQWFRKDDIDFENICQEKTVMESKRKRIAGRSVNSGAMVS
jgi:hypothetical protein